MISLLTNLGAVANVIDAALLLATAVVALTPTQADDNVVARARNVWGALRGALTPR